MKQTKFIVQAAVIAAIYVSLTYVMSLLGLSSGAIQIRISEALTILPFFTPAAIPGLVIGCFLANLLTGCAFWDIVFGTLATLIGAVVTYWLRNKSEYLAPIPPILSNAVIVPFVLMYVYGVQDAYWFLVLTVGIGEIISCGVLGLVLLKALKPQRNRLFGPDIK